MQKAVIERDLKAAIEEGIALRTVIGDEQMTDEQRSKADKLKQTVETLTKDLERVAYFDDLSKTADAEDGYQRVDPEGYDARFSQLCRRFSLRNAIAEVSGMRSTSRDTGLEHEVSTEIARRSGRDYEGMAAPYEALMVRGDWAGLSTRDVSTTTPGAGPGSRIVPTDYRPGDYIDLLRDGLVTRQLGIRVLRGLSGDVRIPKASAGVTAGWATENAVLTTGDPEFAAQVTLTPHKVGAITTFSGQMMIQSSPDIEQLVRADLAEGLARVIDEAVVEGGGSNEPAGVIENTTRTARRTSDPANGVAVNAAEIYDLMQTVDSANIDQGKRAWLLGYELKYHLLQQVLFTGTARTVYESGQLLGVPTVVSNIAPTATRGSLADAPTLIYGNWSDVILGYFGDLDVTANPYGTGFSSGDIQVRILAYADIAFRHDESFQYLDGIIV